MATTTELNDRIEAMAPTHAEALGLLYALAWSSDSVRAALGKALDQLEQRREK